jgi:CBS domain-containing protein
MTMNATKRPPATKPMTLNARTAADLMTHNPLSIRENATVHEAVAFLVDRNVSGAVVIDDAGRPVGVLSQSDVLIHDRERVEYVEVAGEVESGAPFPRSAWDGFHVEKVDVTPVSDLMTPAVFCVALDAPAEEVVGQMCALKVHRLFVVDDQGVLVGVISALDVVRHLLAPSA